VAAQPEVSLRPFDAGDAGVVHRWFNSPEATKTLMEQRESFSMEEAEAWTRRAMDDSGEDRKFAIVVEGYDEPVGFTALYGLFRQTAPELGALIGDDVRGKGVGRRAEALTIATAFDEYGAHRVYGRIPARNEVAKKTVASLGWKHEGTMRGHLRRDGAPAEDCEVWGVLPDEFRAAAADLLPERGAERTSKSDFS
jgi:RimJ/RimL family protein N-acetyltransferase